MKRTTLPLLAALALGITTTAAAAQGTSGQTTGQTAKSPTTQSQTQSGSSGTALHAMSQAKLTESLKKAGFTDVQIVDASYMVHAKSSDGEPVVMVINPPAVTSATGAGTGTSGSSSTSPTMGQGSTSTPGNTSPSGSDSSSTTAPSKN